METFFFFIRNPCYFPHFITLYESHVISFEMKFTSKNFTSVITALRHFESHMISLEKKFTSKNFASVIISLRHFKSHVIFLEKKFTV